MSFFSGEHEHIWAYHPVLAYTFMCAVCPAVARIRDNRTTFLSADKAKEARESAAAYKDKVPKTVREAQKRP